jgi:hypothetical protein
VQYLAAFWLVSTHWPLGIASVKLVTGWMVTATLGMTLLGLHENEHEPESFWPRGGWFRIFLAGIIILISAAAAPRIEAIIPGLGLPIITAGMLLIGMGLIHLGITSQILRVVIGLLTLLTGFEIVYAAVESSILVAGFLAIVNLGIALAGSYMLVANSASDEEME